MAEAAIMLAPTILQSIGGIMGASDQDDALNRQAKALEVQGTEALASAQREAMGERKKGRIASSKLRAIAGASGASGKGVADLAASLQGRSEYNTSAVLFGGKSKQQAAYTQADELRDQGDLLKKNSYLGAFGTLLGGASKAYGKYG